MNVCRRSLFILLGCVFVVFLCISAGCISTPTTTSNETPHTITITDAFGREVTIPDNPQKIAVSGSGSMRYFVYLDLDLDRIVAVDYQDSSLFTRENELRPYLLANPEIKNRAELGSAMAVVDNEKLLASGAEVLFMGGASSSRIEVADEITAKTGIPVVMFYVGDYVTKGDQIRETLRMLGKILHEDARAEEIITYFGSVEEDVKNRVANVTESEKPTVYICGVSYNGAHGADGTDPNYLPFTLLGAKNAASGIGETSQTGYAKVAKEQILAWDPDMIFVDLGTLTAAEGGALAEFRNDPSYEGLSAVKNGEVYAVNPHTSMNVNHETSLANAYYIGKVLYPEQFADIDPAAKADEIYEFVVGAPVYDQLKSHVQNLSYQKMEL
ncbi:ABC transporter substrate-binding protein [Methanocorpusculum sp. MG]|uniref:ABC transporter substrate-binding protein n=1 Tax=Methanocorpusculum petauri TaxID=3002863 RepID=A0ABT4IFV1_9EURY|nr:ABC transporter substrate-binding protein [Methanocorpusculum petauri]MCZ0860254.1 ABC transporter substrate-binding protein [Methanocorpusculum petauri]